MESLVFLHDAIAYEDPPSDLRFTSWALVQRSGAWRGSLSLAVLLAILNQVGVAQAALKLGDRGNRVAQLQQELRINADGIFGPQTQAYVTAYQRLSGIPVTGMADAVTLAALGLPADAPVANRPENSAPTQAPGPVPQAAMTAQNAVVIASSGLNVRDFPAGSVMGRLAYNQSVRLTGDRRAAGRHHWVQLAEGGWVAEAYLKVKDGSAGSDTTGRQPPSPLPVPPSAPKSVVSPRVGTAGRVSARTGLIVRDAPGGSAIGSLPNGQTVQVKGDRQFANGRDWVQLATGGWVAADYVAVN